MAVVHDAGTLSSTEKLERLIKAIAVMTESARIARTIKTAAPA
jgi:hypothetical protein